MEVREVLKQALEAIEDAMCELDDPQVAELTSLALDRKLEEAKKSLKEVLGE